MGTTTSKTILTHQEMMGCIGASAIGLPKEIAIIICDNCAPWLTGVRTITTLCGQIESFGIRDNGIWWYRNDATVHKFDKSPWITMSNWNATVLDDLSIMITAFFRVHAAIFDQFILTRDKPGFIIIVGVKAFCDTTEWADSLVSDRPWLHWISLRNNTFHVAYINTDECIHLKSYTFVPGQPFAKIIVDCKAITKKPIRTLFCAAISDHRVCVLYDWSKYGFDSGYEIAVVDGGKWRYTMSAEGVRDVYSMCGWRDDYVLLATSVGLAVVSISEQKAIQTIRKLGHYSLSGPFRVASDGMSLLLADRSCLLEIT